MIRKLLSGLLLVLPLTVWAQPSAELNAAEIKLGLKKLNVLGSVLYIAAHPDDENTRLLSYLSKELNVRTGYLALTRGDGGQNLIGNEQSELLGLIRTHELLAARRVDGAEQFFTRANDFGFSKNPEETFKIWGKEQILADAVFVIRKFRPDIMIARFPEDSRAGHGNHSGSAIIAREAFAAAADPKRFPEQLKYVKVWQAKRLLVNGYTGDGQLRINIGAFNSLLGKGYGEIAAESRSNHKTQGFGSAKARGQQTEGFSLIAGDLPKSDLFEGVDISWNRTGSARIADMVNKVNQSFDPENPSKSVDGLINVLSEVQKLDDVYWKDQKSKELKELIAACAGLWFESYSVEPVYALGGTIRLRYQAIAQSGIPVTLQKIATGKSDVSPSIALNNSAVQTVDGTVTAEKTTQPYWLEEKHPLGYYAIPNPEFVGNPENPDRLISKFTFSINGTTLTYERPVQYKYTDPVRGEVYQPVVVAPPVTATIPGKAYIFGSREPKTVVVSLKAFAENVKGDLETIVPAGWKISPAKVPLSFTSKGEEQQVEFTITPSANATNGLFSLAVKVGGQTFNKGLKVIDYEHVPNMTLFPPAEAQLVNIDLKTDIKNIGYIDGAGDLVAESLRQLGYKVTSLNENAILNTDLSVYDAIISGVRIYNINPRMRFMQARLMDYVKNGGTYLVQYNNNSGIVVPNIGPYPFTVSGSRVTDEFAKITVLAPEDPALNYPNKITEEDFSGWVQERGLYYVTNIDKNYTPLFSMNDPGESSNNGSIIVGNYGKGKFVYTSLAFFRQLPAGVPGAYRLFVNLLAKKK